MVGMQRGQGRKCLVISAATSLRNAEADGFAGHDLTTSYPALLIMFSAFRKRGHEGCRQGRTFSDEEISAQGSNVDRYKEWADRP
jgi:hypothetical protein